MIRNCFVLLWTFLSLWQSSSAQTFQKLYGDSTVNENGYSLLQTSDGGYVIAGTQFNAGNQIESLLLIRTDGNGDTLWTRRIKEASVNYSGTSVIETYDGGFAITGIKGDGNYFVPYLLKVDSSGNHLWNRSYLWFAQEHINSIVQTPDSGYLLSGYLYNNDMRVYFIRTDANGDTLWTKFYGKIDFNTQVYSLKITPDGGFVAAGFIQDQNTQDVDVFLFKTDAAGNFLWAKSYGAWNYDYGQHVEVTVDGGFILAAVTYTGSAFAEYWLIKTDSLGNLQWTKTYGGAGDDRSETVRQTGDGGYLICGESASFSVGNFDNYFVRTDANGDTLWTKSIHGLQNNEGYSMILTDDGGFAIAGNYVANPSHNDLFFLKADSTGFMGCGEFTTNTIVDTMVVTVTNHPMTFYNGQPSVVAHVMEVKSGTGMRTLCDYDFIETYFKEDLVLYPNPVIDQIRISLDDYSASLAQARVYSMYGQEIIVSVVYEFEQIVIDCNQLMPGIYILEVRRKEGVFFQKFVKG